MKEVFRLYVCNSHQPKQHGGGCCNDKNGTSLVQAFQDQLAQHSLSDKLEIIETTCLKSCLTGISVRVLPHNVTLGRVKVADIPEILDCLDLDQALPERLVIEPVPIWERF